MPANEFSTCSIRYFDRSLVLRGKKSRQEIEKLNEEVVQKDDKAVQANIFELLNSCTGEASLGIGCSKEYSEEMILLLETLEQISMVTNPTKSSNLWGNWKLLFTNSTQLLKNKGVTGLGSLPFVSLVELRQNLFRNGTAETIEVIKPPAMSEALSVLRGPLAVLSPQVVELRYEEAALASILATRAGVGGCFSKAVLAITYLSANLRLCRSPSGALFLFGRLPA